MNRKSFARLLSVYAIFTLLAFSIGGSSYAASPGSGKNAARSELSLEIEQKMNQRGFNVSAQALEDIELMLELGGYDTISGGAKALAMSLPDDNGDYII